MAAGSRTKNQAVRAQRSRATRLRILAAATELLIQDGYLETTMADIAGRAGVAVQTLYLSFGSKVAILAAALDIAIAGDDDPVPVLDRGWYAQVRDERFGPAALAVFVRAASEIIDRHYPLWAAMRAAAADPELAELLDSNKRLRLKTHSTVVAELATKDGFNATLTGEQASDIVYTLLSQETYGLLVAERGWSVADWSAWVERRIRAELFPTASA